MNESIQPLLILDMRKTDLELLQYCTHSTKNMDSLAWYEVILTKPSLVCFGP